MNKKGDKIIRIKKKTIKTWLLILGVIALGILIILIKSKVSYDITTANIAKCIGNHSKLYVQYGCPHCADQEAMFGNNLKYLNYTDCFQNESRQKCIDANITHIPSWIINDKKYEGVMSIPELQNLTGC